MFLTESVKLEAPTWGIPQFRSRQSMPFSKVPTSCLSVWQPVNSNHRETCKLFKPKSELEFSACEPGYLRSHGGHFVRLARNAGARCLVQASNFRSSEIRNLPELLGRLRQDSRSVSGLSDMSFDLTGAAGWPMFSSAGVKPSWRGRAL